MPDIGGPMRIVSVSYDNEIRHEVMNDAGTVVMRAQYIWMATSWCRENSIPYIVCNDRKTDNPK